MSDAPDQPFLLAGVARRRYLTMLFSDLCGSTRFADAMETEHYAELLDELRRCYEEVIPKHGGTIAQIQGDGVLALFSYPEVREDNGRRATEAALELHEAVRGLRRAPAFPGAPPYRLHTGIHSGLVLFDEGDLVRGRFEALGKATNIAKHLADLAGDDEILVSEETLGAESHFFQTSERSQATVGGGTQIAVRSVVGRAPITTRFEARAQRGLAPFVGREAQLTILERSFQEAMAGRPRFMVIAAPAGLGKTRLAEEFLRIAAARDCDIHRGYCESYLGAEPLQPFLQILRSLFRLDHRMSAAQAAAAIEKTLAGIAPQLAHRAELLRALSLSRPADGGELRGPAAENTIAALRELFDAMAATRRLVFFIDDWQSADDATRLAVAAIRSLAKRAVLVLAATRGLAAGDASFGDAQVVELTPFTDDEAMETIVGLLPRADPFVAAEICRYSGGNPLYIEELCHSAALEGADRRPGRMPGGDAWLNTLIASRVARLPGAEADLVRAAAVIGNVIPTWMLESITGCGAGDPLLRGLAEHDFIFPGEAAGTLRFKHAIARDVIYDAVGLHERRRLHLRIAEALRSRSASGVQEDVEALAYHYGAGAQPEQAALYAELAGDKAMAASALDRAQAQYLAALAALDMQSPSGSNYRRWIGIAQRLALACVFDPSREPLEVLGRAASLATGNGDQAALASAEFWLGNINYALGASRVAIGHCERALQAARRVDDQRLIAEIRTTIGQAGAAACDYDRSLVLLDEAIALKRQRRSSGRPAVGLSYTLTCKGSVLGDRGRFREAHACFDEALDAVREIDHAVKGSLHCWRSAVHLWQGRWEDARHAAGEAQRVAERVKSRYLYAMSRALWAYGGWMLERAPESLQMVIDATSWIEARGREQYISLNYGWLTEALAASGRLPEARRNAARAMARARKDDRLGEAMACRAMARASAQGHGRRPATRYLAAAMRAARARGSPHEIAATQMCEAEIRLALGERARARELVDQAAAAFTTLDMAWHLEAAARLRRTL